MPRTQKDKALANEVGEVLMGQTTCGGVWSEIHDATHNVASSATWVYYPNHHLEAEARATFQVTKQGMGTNTVTISKGRATPMHGPAVPYYELTTEVLATPPGDGEARAQWTQVRLEGVNLGSILRNWAAIYAAQAAQGDKK